MFLSTCLTMKFNFVNSIIFLLGVGKYVIARPHNDLDEIVQSRTKVQYQTFHRNCRGEDFQTQVLI